MTLPKLMASRSLLTNESLRKERLFISFFLNDNRFEKTVTGNIKPFAVSLYYFELGGFPNTSCTRNVIVK
jgi:hypothetical protein